MLARDFIERIERRHATQAKKENGQRQYKWGGDSRAGYVVADISVVVQPIDKLVLLFFP
jgi:hypothetical protein